MGMAGFLVRMKKAIAFSASPSACHGSCLIFSYGLQPAWLMFCSSLPYSLEINIGDSSVLSEVFDF